MHGTYSGSRTLIPNTGTVIPSTNSGSRAVILTQKGPSANSENDSEPRATKEPSANEPRAIKKPRAINGSKTLFPYTDRRSRAIIPSTNSRPRAINSNGNADRIDPKRDL